MHGQFLAFTTLESALRLNFALTTQRFVSKYTKNSNAYRRAVPWNAMGRSDGMAFDGVNIMVSKKNRVKNHTFEDFNFKDLHFCCSPTNDQ